MATRLSSLPKLCWKKVWITVRLLALYCRDNMRGISHGGCVGVLKAAIVLYSKKTNSVQIEEFFLSS